MTDRKKEKTIAPPFTEEEKRRIRIAAAHAGKSMRIWIRDEIMTLIEKHERAS